MITRASFCCNEIVRNLHLFLTKVAVKIVTFMHKHFERQWFAQAIYLHIMLNISKHDLGRNGDLLPTVCAARWNFAPQCTKLLGNLTIWPTVLDWWLAASFLQLLFRSLLSSTRSSKRSELYWDSFKACFLNHTFAFCAILTKVACKREKGCDIKILEPAKNIIPHKLCVFRKQVQAIKKVAKTCPGDNQF